MTYDQRYIPTAPVTSEEIVYSPYANGDDFDASMMGTYTSDRAQSVMSSPYAPALASHQNRVMPNYVPPPGYKLVPLGVNESTGMSTAKKVAIVVAVIIAIGVIVYYVQRDKKKSSKAVITPTQAVKKLPTSRLAQNLYARLAKNGKASRGVMAALGQIAQE